MGKITKLLFRPGIHREGTQFAEQGSWYDCDKVRFRGGNPEKIGGWRKVTEEVFKGVCRILFDWTLLDSTNCLALGTHKKMYIEQAGQFYDITPIRFSETATDTITSGAAGSTTQTYTTTLDHGAQTGDYFIISGVTADVDGICTDTYNNPFHTSAAGSGVVIVSTTTPHYAAKGDSVTFSGTTGFDGIPSGDFNTTKTILEVLSANSYTISVTTNATAGAVTGGGTVTAVYLGRLNREFEILSVPTDKTVTFQTVKGCTTGGVTGGGANIVAKFLIFTGFTINVIGGGWGTCTWSRNTWSSPCGTQVFGISLRIWTVDNYGEDFVFAARNGPPYVWDASNGTNTRGVLISSLPGATAVPGEVTVIIVADSRHLVAIGASDLLTSTFDPLLIRWSNQEELTNWTPSITNTAGDIRIPMGSYVVAAKKARQEILVWTDKSLHSLQFSGPPFTFSLQTLAENIDIVGPNAAVNAANKTFWMGKNKFWIYDGRVQNLPCDVQRFVFDNINEEQLAQVYAATNHNFTEVTWLYCDNTSNEINRYVTFNYEMNVWTIGTLSRSAMLFALTRGQFPYGTAGGYTADDGILFQHEIGYDDGSTNPPTPIDAYIESADVSIQDGDKLIFIDRIIPDLTFTRSTSDDASVTITAQAKKFPGQEIQSQDNRAVSKVITATVDRFTEQVWARLRGREMRIKVSSNSLGTSWILGAIRVALRLDGRQ